MRVQKRFLRLNVSLVTEHEKVFDEIYWTLSEKIKKQAFFTVGPVYYEDVVQETFLKIYTGLKSFKHQSSIETWVYRITLNTCLNFLRKHKKTLKDESLDDGKTNLNYSLDIDPMKRKYILEGLATLNEEHKSVFVLYFIMEFKMIEISNILKVKEGTIKSRINTAREKMKEFLMQKGVYDG